MPFFYYVQHGPLIHALTLVVSPIRRGTGAPWFFAGHPTGNPPARVLLYFPSRRLADLEARRLDRWIGYV